MCGVTGAINFSGLSSSHLETVKAMNSSILHRGPDSQGFFHDDFVCLAHRRLSILDLSPSGNQPMLDDSGNTIVIFNGEIYNFTELRLSLEQDFKFRSHSDTEVIIYAYRKWGIEAIRKFTGMFALVLYDKSQKKVFLVRDRLGKKPLYYLTVGDTFYFASEMHAFFEANLLKKDVSEQAVYNYLTFLSTDAPNTFFRNVFKLEAGHYAELSASGLKHVQYWNIADFLNTRIETTYKKAVEESRHLLEISMRYRNVSDVPVSVALSGGIDSSLNLHYSKIETPDVKAINVSYFQKSNFDESVIAEKYSRQLGVEFIGVTVSDDEFASLVREYTGISTDVPSGDINTSLLYLISKTARELGTKVLLVGEGGDELGGYPIYSVLEREYNFFRHFRKISPLLRFIPRIHRKQDMFFNRQIISKRHIHAFTEYEKMRFWTGQKCESTYSVFTKYMDEVTDTYSDSFLRKLSNLEYKLRLPEMILPRIDYPSMAASVEARSPYMDHALIEYSAQLPFSLKMKNGPKSIIKDIAKSKLPEYVMKHPKVGFGMLLTPFLNFTLPSWVKKEVEMRDNPVFEFISKKYLLSLVNERSTDSTYRLWAVFALITWLKNLENGQDA